MNTHIFKSRRKTGTTTTTKTRSFDFGNELFFHLISHQFIPLALSSTYPIVTLEDHLLRLVPITILHGRLEIGTMMTIQIRKNAVLVLQSAICLLRSRSILNGSEGSGCRRQAGSGSRRGQGGGPVGDVGESRGRGDRCSRHHFNLDAQWRESRWMGRIR